MTLITQQGAPAMDPWGAVSRWLSNWWREGEADPDTAEADRARRDFVDDMLSRNADAFASEADVLGMMQLYPGRF